MTDVLLQYFIVNDGRIFLRMGKKFDYNSQADSRYRLSILFLRIFYQYSVWIKQQSRLVLDSLALPFGLLRLPLHYVSNDAVL